MTSPACPRVELRILDPRLEAWGVPRFHSEMAAAVDLLACCEAPMVIAAGTPAVLISSGLAVHIGDAHIAALVLPRSGLGHKTGLVLGNAVGLIDADYQGPLMISAWNRNAPGSAPITIEPGDRIAQLMFVPIVRPQLTIVEEFTAGTERAAGGFGSTGVR